MLQKKKPLHINDCKNNRNIYDMSEGETIRLPTNGINFLQAFVKIKGGEKSQFLPKEANRSIRIIKEKILTGSNGSVDDT